jgi:hypothetical protein
MDNATMESIAKKHGVKDIYFIEPGDKWCQENGKGTYENTCWRTGSMANRDCELWVGIFDDTRLKVRFSNPDIAIDDATKTAHFFESLGACVLGKNLFKDDIQLSHFDYWQLAFCEGVRLAAKEGFRMDPPTLKACVEPMCRENAKDAAKEAQ